MKKSLFAAAGVLVIGGVIGLSIFDAEEKDVGTEAVEQSVTSTATEVTEVKEPPKARTVEVNAGYPWEYYTAKDIIQLQKDGEIVYLYSDAEAFENTILEFVNSEEIVGAPVSKADNGISFSEYLDGFIQGVEPYHPLDVGYFDKMREVVADLKSANFDAVPVKIKEAQALRTE